MFVFAFSACKTTKKQPEVQYTPPANQPKVFTVPETKEPAKPADMEIPLIMFRNCTVGNVCSKLHKDFVKKFKFARVWGKSVKYDGQKVIKLKHELRDQDIVELHID